jgi:uncharacterized protein YndB with AHSA1/START domain
METVKELSVTHSTFVIERNYPVTPERVFAAFADPAKKRRWFANDEGGTVEEYEMDFRVGGRERRSGRLQAGTPFDGSMITNDTVYQDIVPGRRIVLAYTMTLGEKRISASLATFEFLPAGKGTELVFTEQAAFFEGGDGPQMRQEGWSKLLDYLGEALLHQEG